jgi:hypothetical protein
MTTQTKSIEEFHYESNRYISNCLNNRYILELTKLCGYFEWTTIYKYQSITLYDLYTIVESHFQQPNIKLYVYVKNVKLYVHTHDQDHDHNHNQGPETTEEEEEEEGMILIPKDNNILFQSYIDTYREFFPPVYPVPANIVYKIYVEDRCKHSGR